MSHHLMNARCGFSVAVNRPYAGTLVPFRYYQKNRHVLEVKSKALHERRNRREKFSIPKNCFGHPIAGNSAARLACRPRQPDLAVMKVEVPRVVHLLAMIGSESEWGSFLRTGFPASVFVK